MSKTFWAVIAIIAIVFGGIVVISGDKNSKNGANGAQPTNHLFGQGESGVKLIEYGDYQCPFCGQFYPIVEEVKKKYEEQITFQFRNLPLVQIHQNAFAAARAAEAADKQGKFWEMYNLLFQNQQAWSSSNNARPIFDQYAQQLGLNVDQFKTDFASEAVNDAVNADIAEFEKTGHKKSTPTFLLDGKKVEPKSLEDFSKLIDEAIAKKTST
jgi:protein-disulfide isomerase